MPIFVTCFILLFSTLSAQPILQKPIAFGERRIELSKLYLKEHYQIEKNSIEIIPQMIVIHWTASDKLENSFNGMAREEIPSGRKNIASASSLGVSAHYLVDRDGSIYQLMPDDWMARHVIGLNHIAIGIENVGGAEGKENLTKKQLLANQFLVKHLRKKYPSISYLIGHHEYQDFEKHPLWAEKNKSYRTIKVDPGKKFMKALREKLSLSHNPKIRLDGKIKKA